MVLGSEFDSETTLQMALRVQGEVDTNTYEDRLNDKLHVPVMRRGKVSHVQRVGRPYESEGTRANQL